MTIDFGKTWRRSAAVALMLAGSVGLGSLAHATPVFSKMVVFGDSLSDSGNTRASLGILGGFLGTSVGYGTNGRFSNGIVWHEALAPMIGVPVATASRVSGANNNNFAHGGARIDNASGSSAGLLNQYASYNAKVGVGNADPNALYAVWGGGNDMRDLVGNANPLTGIANSLANLESMLTGLISSGATSFLIPNLPDLGKIPENRGKASEASASNVSGLWNAGLLSLLMELKDQASFYYLDVFSSFNDLLDNPANYGMSNTTGQCRSVSGATEVSCANPDTWAFWDAIHPTRASHAVLAAAAFNALNGGTVPEPGTLLLAALALLAAWKLSRRNAVPALPQAVAA